MAAIENFRSLGIRLHFEAPEKMDLGDFLLMTQFAEQLVRRIIADEAKALLAELGLKAQPPISLGIRGFPAWQRKLRLPSATVESIRKGSWIVELAIPSVVVIWCARHMIAPVVLEAWEQGASREKIARFLREHIFGGAKKQTENYRWPSSSALEIVLVEESQDQIRNRITLTVRLRMGSGHQAIDTQQTIEELLRHSRERGQGD